MIVIIVVLLLVGSQIIAAEPTNNTEFTETTNNRFIFNVVIRQLFELFREVVRNGDLEKDIPALDPYEFNADMDFTNNFMSVSVNLSSGVFSGLGDYQLGPFNFKKNELSIDVELTFPLLKLYSEHYSFDGKLFGLLSASGNGLLQISLHSMVFKGKIYLKQSDDEKSILISHLENAEFTIETVKSNTEFDGKIDEVANAMLEDLLADHLSRYSKAICASYGDVAVKSFNSILIKFDNWKIISVIL